MICFTSVAILSFVLAAFAAPLEKPDVEKVMRDISIIAKDTKVLNSAIADFPMKDGTSLQALSIHFNSENLGFDLNQGTTDIKDAGEFDSTDGQSIMQSLHEMEPNVFNALDVLVEKKVALENLPLKGIANLIKEDLEKMKAATIAFEDTLMPALPESLQAQVIQTKSILEKKFSLAIAVYS